ncbi:hypothetical protein J5754_05645 [bacterium]|nr:hypothetical protein [bacterium]MBR5946407.1 hypothetical protein [bacterium]
MEEKKPEKQSMEDVMHELQSRTKCPYAEEKLFIYAQAMDPYNRRYIVLECPARRNTISDSKKWKVYQEEINELCCNPYFAYKCESYKLVKELDKKG